MSTWWHPDHKRAIAGCRYREQQYRTTTCHRKSKACCLIYMDLLSPQLSAHSTPDQNSIERKIGITPNLIGHRLQHPYAEGWTCEIQEQAQAAATGRPNTQPGRIYGAVMTLWRTRQERIGLPTRRRKGAGGCMPHKTKDTGTPQQDPSNAASCTQGDAGHGRQLGQGGKGRDKPWQPRRAQGHSETQGVAPHRL